MRIAPLIAAIAGCAIAIAIISLSLGRRISMLVDRLLPGPPIPKPTDPISISFDPDGISSYFSLGPSGWSFSWPHAPGPLDLKIILSRHNLLILRAGNRSFTFGPVQKWWTGSKPQYQFTPAPGDIVSFTRDQSRLPWLTPFTFNTLGVSVPKAKRFAYDRLRWTKPSGAILEVTWRGEYWFYPRSGWADTYNNRLVRVLIRPSPLEKSATAYLAATKGWSPDEYRLEPQPPTSEDAIIEVVYLKDESAAVQPGAGQSVVLRMDKSSRKVISESGWQ
jgi:hypothetical protein